LPAIRHKDLQNEGHIPAQQKHSQIQASPSKITGKFSLLLKVLLLTMRMGAAKKIDLILSGTARVRLEVLEWGTGQ
jgi:hypothetical protein